MYELHIANKAMIEEEQDVFIKKIDADGVTFSDNFVLFIDGPVVVYCIPNHRVLSFERIEEISEISPEDSPVLQSISKHLDS